MTPRSGVLSDDPDVLGSRRLEHAPLLALELSDRRNKFCRKNREALRLVSAYSFLRDTVNTTFQGSSIKEQPRTVPTALGPLGTQRLASGVTCWRRPKTEPLMRVVPI